MKEEINRYISEKNQITPTLLIAGYDWCNEFGEKPNNKAKDGSTPIIIPPILLSFNHSSLLSYSIYDSHSVLVTSDHLLKAVGYNKDGRIASSFQKTEIDHFIDFGI